jgi:hypothetical protein
MRRRGPRRATRRRRWSPGPSGSVTDSVTYGLCIRYTLDEHTDSVLGQRDPSDQRVVMPIQNTGTVLENIVLLEATRVTISEAPSGPVEFVNSFAMPPLTDWIPNSNNAGMNSRRIEILQSRASARASDRGNTYPQLLSRCLSVEPEKGPNGALLVALLARMAGRQFRFWVNDNGSRYPGPGRSLGSLSRAIVPEGPDAEIVDCEDSYPGSLEDLAATLEQ